MSDARVPRIPAALSAPSLNRGVGFTHAQRRRLGLTGRLPSAVLTLDQQAERVWHQLQSLATELGRNLLLEQLHYRHEVLYFKVLADHLPELMPVVYTRPLPTDPLPGPVVARRPRCGWRRRGRDSSPHRCIALLCEANRCAAPCAGLSLAESVK